MDTLVQQYLSAQNVFDFKFRSRSVHQKQSHEVNEYNYNNRHGFEDSSEISNGSSNSPVRESSPSGSGSDGHTSHEGDPHDPMLKYISEMLMEEDDLENKPCMFHDCSALQAAEKSFYDVLNEPKNRYSEYNNADSPSQDSWRTSSSDVNSYVEPNWILDQKGLDLESSLIQSSYVNHGYHQSILDTSLQSLSSADSFFDAAREMDESLMSLLQASDSSVTNKLNVKSDSFTNGNNFPNIDQVSIGKTSRNVSVMVENEKTSFPDGSNMKKNRYRDDDSEEEEPRSKQLAGYSDEVPPMEQYDNVLLCPCLNPHLEQKPLISSPDEASNTKGKDKSQQIDQSKGSTKGRARGGKKSSIRREVVDLRSLLVQCAQAVATYDTRTSTDLLNRIRQHSSPYGDGVERLAHYFANALEARLGGIGTTLYAGFRARRISAADILKGYQMYVTACPFKKVSNVFANRSIGKLAAGATTLHIIDFGILYGFQWPCLIQRLSMRKEGPPKLRITGVDLPQPGLRPAERVKETGLRLERYCQRFNVPFEYNAIAKKWDTIQPEDFKIGEGELLVVNCMDRLANVPDETVMENSPRDAVLKLIKKIRPALFVQGVINGTYNSPFFATRFREALFHFSSLFDMFETTVPRENKERTLFEQEILGRDALNVIACEGTERVERPETYKQWQVRNIRAGFKQLPLDRETMKRVVSKVASRYHKDFSVDEDSNWLLQGWKGRVVYAQSCWQPV
ncbi:hypothetical protein M9H77_15847 [Catharanthus roseus]|uniref:Uncharacterized protein n=1 Tax=Catharanthus roseus TaxID=4058 RepID=A0ACC0AYN4_CATRO|nr:hypothetical protein M9H77_15847 [Catharanthus roseus]